MDLELKGKVAVVGGASKGLGRACAQALAQEGAQVAICSRSKPDLDRAAQEIRDSTGSDALAFAGDLDRPETIRELITTTVQRFGRLDILVNNSGGPPRTAAIALDPESVQAAVELLLVSVVRLTSLCLPHLQRSGRGRIVNVTSSSVREPIDNLALSNAVRPGVVGWAKTLARELGPMGITVNSIAPGWIDTERIREVNPEGVTDTDLASIPIRRLGTPREIGDLVAFLCSDRAAYVTGTVIPIDGGLTRSLL
jgi:3-oxoacyl-[acyl-carrier protein] reductase